MLTYVRRKDYLSGRVIPRPVDENLFTHPIVGYCNWSFSERSHINEKTLVDAFLSYDQRFLPFYVKIFNEVPVQVAADFLQANQIQGQAISLIYETALVQSGARLSRALLDLEDNQLNAKL